MVSVLDTWTVTRFCISKMRLCNVIEYHNIVSEKTRFTAIRSEWNNFEPLGKLI